MVTESKSGPTDIASCCSAFYEQDWVRLLAEESFHPGGQELTRRTVAAMELPPAASLLDLGCGTGTTALLLARETDLTLCGADVSAANIERATARAGDARIRFVQADAHALPFEDNEFDGVLIECVFSLLADKPGALAGMRRVLKPGGRVGLTDMAVGGKLADDIAAVVAPWTCLTDAVDEDAYTAMFETAGLEFVSVDDESAGLTELVANIKRKLLALGAGSLLQGGAGAMPDLATIKHWLDRFQDEVEHGSVRYLRFTLQSR